MAAELMAWTDTCQPASFARPIVAVRSARSQSTVVPEPSSRWIFEPLDPEAVLDRAGLARHVPVAEELVAEVQGEIGVDTKREGILSGQRGRARRDARD